MTTTPASIETAPTDVAELALIGRFNVRMLAQKLGIFDSADEAARTAFLAQNFEVQCQQVSDALIEARGGKKAKKGAAAAAAPARTPVNSKTKKAAPPPPPEDEEEDDEEVDEEEVDEEVDEEEVDEEDDEEEAPPPPPARRATGGVPARAPVAAPKAAPPPARAPAAAAAPVRTPAAAAAPQAGVQGAQLLTVVQNLQKTVNDIAGVVQGLAESVSALQDSVVLGYRHTAVGTGVSLKIAEQILGANSIDVITVAMEELCSTEAAIAQFINADPEEEAPAPVAKPKGTKVKGSKGK
jgi:hypothetical protein